MSDISKVSVNGTEYDIKDSGGRALIDAEAAARAADVADLKDDITLLADEIPNTVQTYTFTGGTVSQIVHKTGDVTVRTDSFAYGENTITETRVLNTGDLLRIETDLTTLQTTVTYTAA